MLLIIRNRGIRNDNVKMTLGRVSVSSVAFNVFHQSNTCINLIFISISIHNSLIYYLIKFYKIRCSNKDLRALVRVLFEHPSYNGRISDKALTIDCGYLDSVPPYSNIMADKGFNLTNECAERNLSIYVPPGRRGTSQMTTAAVSKTKNIANKRILIEQVIRRIKTFKIIQNELPISLVPHVDDILQTCSGICNLKKPIYK